MQFTPLITKHWVQLWVRAGSFLRGYFMQDLHWGWGWQVWHMPELVCTWPAQVRRAVVQASKYPSSHQGCPAPDREMKARPQFWAHISGYELKKRKGVSQNPVAVQWLETVLGWQINLLQRSLTHHHVLTSTTEMGSNSVIRQTLLIACLFSLICCLSSGLS